MQAAYKYVQTYTCVCMLVRRAWASSLPYHMPKHHRASYARICSTWTQFLGEDPPPQCMEQLHAHLLSFWMNFNMMHLLTCRSDFYDNSLKQKPDTSVNFISTGFLKTSESHQWVCCILIMIKIWKITSEERQSSLHCSLWGGAGGKDYYWRDGNIHKQVSVKRTVTTQWSTGYHLYFLSKSGFFPWFSHLSKYLFTQIWNALYMHIFF